MGSLWRRPLLAALLATLPIIVSSIAPAAATAAEQPVTIVGTLTVGSAPSAIAIDPSTHTVFVTNQDSNSVSIIDETTQRVVASIPVGKRPVAVTVDTSTHLVYAADAQSNALSILDGVKHQVVATVAVGYLPGAIAVDSSEHRLYVADQSTDPRCASGCYDDIRVLDALTFQVQTVSRNLNTWIYTMVMDPASHNLVYTFDGKYEDGGVAVLDSALRAVTGGTLRYTVGGVAVDPATQQLFVGRLMTDLVALERTPGQYMPFHETTVKVGVGIHHLALDPTTETLYVANASSHTVSVVDVSTGQVIATVAVGSPSTVYFSPDGPGPGAIAVDPVTHQVYVADMGGHTVTVLQGVTTAVPNAPAMPDTGAGGGRWLQQPVQAPTTTTSSPCAGSAASCCTMPASA